MRWRIISRPAQDHPIGLLRRLRFRVTVNTDNRLITDTTVSREMWLAHTEIGLSLADLKQTVLNGFKSAFLPFHEKRHYLAVISRQLDAFAEDGTIDEALLASTQQQLYASGPRPSTNPGHEPGDSLITIESANS